MMDEEKPKKKRRNYTKKPSTPLVERPTAFMADEEFNLTDMQTAFVWHYVNDNCTQTEAAPEKKRSIVPY